MNILMSKNFNLRSILDFNTFALWKRKKLFLELTQEQP